MKEYLIYSLLITLIITGCTPDDTLPLPPDIIIPIDSTAIDCPNYDSDHLEVLWYSPLHSDTLRAFSMYPKIHNNGICFSDRLSEDGFESISFYDLNSGNVQWSWDGTDNSSYLLVPNTSDVIIEDDIYFNSGKELFSLDLTNGQLNWKLDITNSSPRITTIKTNIYYGGLEYNGVKIVKAHLYQVTPEGETQIIYTRSIENNYEPFFEMPSSYISEAGDQILIFQSRSWNFTSGINSGKIDLIAYNLDKNLIHWEISDLTPDGNSSVFSPIIQDQRVYFQGANSIHCVDAESGDQIWSEQILGESFFQGPALLENDLLVLNGDTRSIYAFNIEDGSLAWQNDDTGSTVPNMAYYRNHIYFGSQGTGKLYKIKLGTGEKVFEASAPNGLCSSSAAFIGGVTIDQETGYLYTHDTFFAMCIDLNN